MSQLLLGAGLHVDQAKILMLNLSSHENTSCPFLRAGRSSAELRESG